VAKDKEKFEEEKSRKPGTPPPRVNFGRSGTATGEIPGDTGQPTNRPDLTTPAGATVSLALAGANLPQYFDKRYRFPRDDIPNDVAIHVQEIGDSPREIGDTPRTPS
jgi:hypothetical protein